MHTNDFKIFQAVAEYGSFTKAAAITNTVQSNVTARIKFLEQEFNTQLIRRTTRRVELTEAGLKLLKVAKELQMIIDNAKVSINGSEKPVKGVLKIGCIHTTAALRVPGILENFTNEFPEVEFRLKTNTTANLVKEVLSCKIDGAFVAGKIKNTDVVVQPVIDEELCLVTGVTNPTLDHIRHSSGAIKLVVFTKGCSYREKLGGILKKLHISRYNFIEMDTLEGIINTVESGIGITLLPAELIKKHYKYRNLITIPLPRRLAKSKTVFIRRKDFPMSKGYHLFLQSIIDGYSSRIS